MNSYFTLLSESVVLGLCEGEAPAELYFAFDGKIGGSLALPVRHQLTFSTPPPYR